MKGHSRSLSARELGDHMDPLAVVGTAALTQAVSFLFGQVKDLLERRRARAAAQSNAAVDAPVLAPGAEDGVLDGPLRSVPVDPGVLEDASAGLKVLAGVLEDYRYGVMPVRVEDPALLRSVGAARDALEGLYGQSITFRGEADRPETGSPLGAAEVDARVGAITASGQAAVAAHTISGPLATSGGMAAGRDLTVGMPSEPADDE